MLVVGGGLVGLSVAWQLLRRGHPVRLVDPGLERPDPSRSGSWAALGVWMADVFHRSSGRGWRLRQRSLELWGHWLRDLAATGQPLPSRQGLLLLASSAEEQQRQQTLVAARQAMGVPLNLWGAARLAQLQPALPGAALGAVESPRDGQVDPGAVLSALWTACRALGLQTCRDEVVALQRRGRDWQALCRGGGSHPAAWLVISAGVESGRLLEGLGHPLPMQPVLGQALELELAEPPAWTWPGVCVWRGLNLVPRPDLPGGWRCWLGASLEPGRLGSAQALEEVRSWAAADLPWLAGARLVRQWQGLRCRPVGRPAPVLEQLEPGLLVVSGHYRNGVLLAPASAEWACQQVGAGRGSTLNLPPPGANPWLSPPTPPPAGCSPA